MNVWTILAPRRPGLTRGALVLIALTMLVVGGLTEARPAHAQADPVPPGVIILPPDLPDLQVTEWGFSSPKGPPSWCLRFTVTNTGQGRAGPFAIDIVYASTIDFVQKRIDIRGGLDPGKSTEMIFWYFQDGGIYCARCGDSWRKFGIIVDSTKAVTESNEANNSVYFYPPC